MDAPSHHRAVALALCVALALGLGRLARGRAPAPPPARPDARLDAQPAPPRAPRRAVDPNRDDEAALATLPGIGPALARRIVAARRGGVVFRRAADLARVRGIGPRTAARLAPYVTFAPRAPDAGAGALTGPR